MARIFKITKKKKLFTYYMFYVKLAVNFSYFQVLCYEIQDEGLLPNIGGKMEDVQVNKFSNFSPMV